MTFTVYRGDARDLSMVEDGSIGVMVTSIPYWGQRDYGDSDDEIGKGSLDDYIHKEIVPAFREIHRALDDRGVAWLNVSDTSAGSGGAGGDYNKGGTKEGQRRYRQGDSGLPRMQQCLVPERLVIALQEDFFDERRKKPRWHIRKRIVWDQTQCRREDLRHVKRPLIGHEMVFMLTKGTKYRWNADPLLDGTIKDQGDVWRFPPVKGKRKGDAPFPEELPRRCILLSAEPGDVVLDPFVGSGTTGTVAHDLGFDAVGVDLYARAARKVVIA